MAVANYKLGLIAMQQLRWDAAHEFYVNALTLLESLPLSSPLQPKTRGVIPLIHGSQGHLFAASMKFDEAEQSYTTALRICEKLHSAFPQDKDARQVLVLAYDHLAQLYSMTDRQRDAQVFYEKSLQLKRQFAAEDQDRDNPALGLALVETLSSLGGVYNLLGDTSEAIAIFREGLELTERAIQQHPAVIAALNETSKLASGLAVTYQRIGNFDDALRFAQRGATAALAAEESSPSFLMLVADSHRLLASIHASRGEHPEAEAAYRMALARWTNPAGPFSGLTLASKTLAFDSKAAAHEDFAQFLVKAARLDEARQEFQAAVDARTAAVAKAPANAEMRIKLALSHLNLGDCVRELGDPNETRLCYDRAASAVERLDRSTNGAARPLAFVFCRIGGFHLGNGDVGRARDFFILEEKWAEAAIREKAEDVGSQVALASATERVGNIEFEFGRWRAAAEHYRRAVDLNARLSETMPKSVEARIDLADALFRLGDAEINAGELQAAQARFERAVEVIESIDPNTRTAAPFDREETLKKNRTRLGYCRLALRLIADPEFAPQDPADVPIMHHIRSAALARTGKHADAAASAERLAEFGKSDPMHWYDAGRCIALCVQSVTRDRSVDQISDADRVLQERYASRAMGLLQQATAGGFFKQNPGAVDDLKQSRDLDALRERPDFQAFVARVEGQE